MTTAITEQMNEMRPLRFSQSESKTIGLGGELMQKAHDNGGRLTAGLHIAGNAALMLSGNPLAMASAALGIAGKLLMVAYGTKEHQATMAAHPDCGNESVAGDGVVAGLAKTLHPQKYPVEAASGLSIASSMLMLGYGFSLESSGKAGLTPIISEVVDMGASAYLMIGKEKGLEEQVQEPLPFANSKSKALAWTGKEAKMLKDNPVLTNALVNLVVNTGILIGGIIESNPYVAISGAFFLASSVSQALFVRKNDYNIEGAQEKLHQQATAPEQAEKTFVEKEMARRNNAQLQTRVA